MIGVENRFLSPILIFEASFVLVELANKSSLVCNVIYKVLSSSVLITFYLMRNAWLVVFTLAAYISKVY